MKERPTDRMKDIVGMDLGQEHSSSFYDAVDVPAPNDRRTEGLERNLIVRGESK